MKKLLLTFASAALMLGSPSARTGVYADDLSKCLVTSTTEADRAMLMKWIFSAISLNKEISSFVNLPADTRTRINQDAAGLYMRLLTESCKLQTYEAFKYEGDAAIGSAFQILGQVASQGIFSDPAVATGMTDLTKFFDEKKLNAVLEGK